MLQEAKIIKIDNMFHPFLALYVYSLPCIIHCLVLNLNIFSIKVLDLDLFQMLKNISVYFLDLFENEERLSEKQRLFILPSPSSTKHLYPPAIDMWII